MATSAGVTPRKLRGAWRRCKAAPGKGSDAWLGSVAEGDQSSRTLALSLATARQAASPVAKRRAVPFGVRTVSRLPSARRTRYCRSVPR